MFNKRKIAIYALIILIVSIGFGIIYGSNNELLSKKIIDNISSNNLYLHITVSLLLLILSLSYLGFISSSVILSIDGVSIGYIIYNLFKLYKLKGILYYLVYFLIFKLPFILVIIYILYISYRYNTLCYENINNKRNDYYKSITKYIIYKFLIVFVSTILYDGILYIFGSKIINLLKIML